MTKTINLEVYKRTRNVGEAERKQRIFDWEVGAVIEYLDKGSIKDAEDLLIAYLGVRENAVTPDTQNGCDRILREVGKRGHEQEEKQLRWSLQKYLKGISGV